MPALISLSERSSAKISLLLLLRRWAGRCALVIADRIAGEYEFYTTVLLTAFGRVVRGNRLSFAETFRGNLICRDSLLYQVIANRIGAIFGELLVVFIGANAIGVTFDLKVQGWIREYDSRNFR